MQKLSFVFKFEVTIFFLPLPLCIPFVFTRGARDIANQPITSKNSSLDIGKLTRTFFAFFQLVFRGVFARSFLSCRSRKFVPPLHGNFEILRSFVFFILAKYYDSFNKFNKYFLQSLDSNLFFREWIFYRMPIHKLKINLFHVRPIPKREAIMDKLLR